MCKTVLLQVSSLYTKRLLLVHLPWCSRAAVFADKGMPLNYTNPLFTSSVAKIHSAWSRKEWYSNLRACNSCRGNEAPLADPRTTSKHNCFGLQKNKNREFKYALLRSTPWFSPTSARYFALWQIHLRVLKQREQLWHYFQDSWEMWVSFPIVDIKMWLTRRKWSFDSFLLEIKSNP